MSSHDGLVVAASLEIRITANHRLTRHEVLQSQVSPIILEAVIPQQRANSKGHIMRGTCGKLPLCFHYPNRLLDKGWLHHIVCVKLQ